LHNPETGIKELIRFRNQYIITQQLHHPILLQIETFLPYPNGLALVMAAEDNCSLKDYLEKNIQTGLPLTEVLTIGIQMADVLHYLGEHRILHKDIKPANILIDPDTLQIQLIDFGLASLLPKEVQELRAPKYLEGTLAYMAPEQTGRMNRGIDYRVDFYSLGVTLYELLTGQRPFQSSDSLELIYCHLAQPPKPPTEVQGIDSAQRTDTAKLPNVVSDIVLKLMAKNAEDRYQCGLGLKYDLEQCLRQWQQTGTVNEFELGQRDRCDRIIPPQHLYGRDAEVKTLLDAFEHVTRGSAELILVAGYSGIGKTAVIREIHKPITRQKGYFIQGKFDQFNRNIPFSAFVLAFRDLMGQLLGEPDTALAMWKTKILEVVGNNGQVLIDVIPELEYILGPQPTVPELSGSAAQNRFNLLFSKFVCIFTTQDHPLVIFLDDLQWVDLASLKLLQLLVTQAKADCLLILGAYRDNEVFPEHPLMLTLEQLQKQQATFRTLTLTPLTANDVTQLVADTLRCLPTTAARLSQRLYPITQGNPFFTLQFLQGLYEEGCIYFDATMGRWKYDLAQIQQLELADDVVRFMVKRLQKLPAATQETLKLAACIGNRFDLETLAIICESRQGEVASNLWKSLRSGLIIPETEIYKFFQKADQGVASLKDITVDYHFLHDRVQQAAYALIPQTDKQAIHLKIGQLLLKNLSPNEQEENIFKVVGQLNMGRDLLTTQTDRDQLAQLNLEAGRKAKTSTAYSAAINYLSIARQLLAPDCWQHDYQTTLEIFIETLELEYLNTNFDAVESLADSILGKTQNLLDCIKIYEIKIRAWIGYGDQHRALAIGLDVLNRLDISLCECKPDLISDVAGLIHSPVMADPYKLSAMTIMAHIITPAWAVSPDDFRKITFTMVDLSLRYGNCAASAFGYVWYGTLLCEALGNINEGYEFGRLSVEILNHFDTRELQSKVLVLYASCVIPWKKHIQEALPIHLKGLEQGLETGDLEFASYGAAEYGQYMFLSGLPLFEVRDQIEQKISIIRTLKQTFHIDYLAPWLQGILNLLGESETLNTLNGPIYNEEERLPRLIEQKQLTTVFVAYFVKSFLSYLFEDFDKAVEHGQQARNHSGGVAGTFFIPAEMFYSSLARIACLGVVDSSKQQSERQNINTCLEKLKCWATHAPENYQHKCELIEAELARCDRKFLIAMDQYDCAIAHAKENKHLQEEALANELAARLYLDWGKDKVAAGYMQEAYECYTRWGAKAKTDHLERHYPNLLQPIFQNQPTEINSAAFTAIDNNIVTTSSYSYSDWNLKSADFIPIMKSAQALAQNTDLKELIQQLIQISLISSGAQICMIAYFDTHRQWVIQGSSMAPTEKPNEQPSTIVVNPLECPTHLIHWAKNTKTTMTIDGQSSLAMVDDYLLNHQPQSVFCAPILKGEQVLGVLYLEHRQATDIFTKRDQLILSFLCAQAAIAFENVSLYQVTQTLQTEQSYFTTLLANIPHMAWLQDISGHLLAVNQPFSETFGQGNSTGMVGKHYTEWLPKSLTEQFYVDTLEITTIGQPKATEIEIILANSPPRWYEVIKNPIRDARGQITGLVGIWIDIQTRKRIESELQVVENDYRVLSTQIPGVVFQLCQETDGTLSFSYINATCYELCQLSATAIMTNANCLLGMIHSEDIDGAKTAINQSANTLAPLLWTGCFVLPSGDLKWIKIAARPESNERGVVIWDGVLLEENTPIPSVNQGEPISTVEQPPALDRLKTWSFSQAHLNQPFSSLEFSDSFLEQVKSALIELLPTGQCSAMSVAKKLEVSPRTLRRRLQDEGTNFKAIVSQMRLALAKHYLRQSDLSCKHISTLIGYDNPSSFTRAFRTATGTTPEEFRENDD
ncbi:MAG: AAA family ATPase, partial [Leptolyngbya sp. SIO3F4]|nr:AAA family ATPase [Leptolyngbya sp. SIO3F4]